MAEPRRVWRLSWDGDPAMGGGFHRQSVGAEFSSFDGAKIAASRTRIDLRPGFRIETRLVTEWELAVTLV